MVNCLSQLYACYFFIVGFTLMLLKEITNSGIAGSMMIAGSMGIAALFTVISYQRAKLSDLVTFGTEPFPRKDQV